MADELKFDWDATSTAHIARHKVTPKEVKEALINDPFDVGYDVIDGEERWSSIGHTDDLRVLLLVWTLRGENTVRVITAREASKTARRTYLREKRFGI